MSSYFPRPNAKPNLSRSSTPTSGFSERGSAVPTFEDLRNKLSYDRPDFAHIDGFGRSFSPSAKNSGEEILRDLKHKLRRGGDMFFSQAPHDWGFAPKSLFTRAEDGEETHRGMDDPRGRHSMFRMPAWMSEDEDMTDLAARMSHAPHFATLGRRGGPWRERRSSGGSAMSATSEDDSCDTAATDKSSQGSADANSHEIPIRLVAPAPQQQQQQQQQSEQQQPVENEPVAPLGLWGGARRAPQCPVRTTSAVDASDHSSEVPRTTRCASAPPEMANQGPHSPPSQQRFVSKINITPQQPQGSVGSPTPTPPFSPLPAKFNTVPKPFVATGKQEPQPQQQAGGQQQQPQYQQPHMQDPQWQYQQQQQQPFYQQPHDPQQYQQYYQQQPQQQYQHYSQPQYQQQQPPQPQQRPGQRPSVVRNIPIFVEGRDGPEEPAPGQRTGPQWSQARQEQSQPQPPQPQAPQPTARQRLRGQHAASQPQTQPIPQPVPMPMPESHQPIPQPVPMPMPEPHQPIPQPVPMPMPAMPEPHQPIPQPVPMPESHQTAQPAPAQMAEPSGAEPAGSAAPAQDPRLTKIDSVRTWVAEIMPRVDAWKGGKKDREFMYLDEMLTRALLKLDNVDPDGREDVRQARRAAIRDINNAITSLEVKLNEVSQQVPAESTAEPAQQEQQKTEKQQQPESAVEGNSQEAAPSPSQAPESTSDIAKNEQQQQETATTEGGQSEAPAPST